MAGGRGNRRTKKRSKPIQPGPAVCSPYAARRNLRSCVPDDVLNRVRSTTQRGRGSAPQGCGLTNTRCLVEHSELPYKEKKRILTTYFRPKQPTAWKADPDMWLNSDDIETVLRQYEKAYPHFRFLGVVPIDFSAPDPTNGTGQKCISDQFCKVDLKAELNAGHTLVGAVFNLDPSYKSGSHWVAMAIDLNRKKIYYFDSYGMKPPMQVSRYMRYFLLQDKELKLQFNARRFQFSNTECGMYSIYFLIRMIQGESFKKFCKNPIADKWMLEFRNILFDPAANE
jgi:hypothetical protein